MARVAALRVPTRYLNAAENLFLKFAKRRGWLLTKRGWPDFLCRSKSGEWFVVEVKPRSATGKLRPLKSEQILVLEWLSSLGVRCYVSDGETLERFAAEGMTAAMQMRLAREPVKREPFSAVKAYANLWSNRKPRRSESPALD